MKPLLVCIAFGFTAASSPSLAQDPFSPRYPEIVTRSPVVGCFSSEETPVADEYYFTHIRAGDFIHAFGCEVIPADSRLYVTDRAKKTVKISRSSGADVFGLWILDVRSRWRRL
jgi:hypothetical protein